MFSIVMASKRRRLDETDLIPIDLSGDADSFMSLPIKSNWRARDPSFHSRWVEQRAWRTTIQRDAIRCAFFPHYSSPVLDIIMDFADERAWLYFATPQGHKLAVAAQNHTGPLANDVAMQQMLITINGASFDQFREGTLNTVHWLLARISSMDDPMKPTLRAYVDIYGDTRALLDRAIQQGWLECLQF
jgi:hypothetical protein